MEAVLQLVRTKPDSYILLCAPSDPATDTLAKRLAAHLGVGEMLRLQNQTRTFAEVPVELLPYSFILNDRFACQFSSFWVASGMLTLCYRSGVEPVDAVPRCGSLLS